MENKTRLKQQTDLANGQLIQYENDNWDKKLNNIPDSTKKVNTAFHIPSLKGANILIIDKVE